MALEDRITEIVESLRTGSFHNEPSVSQCILLPILSELKWNIFNPLVVWPEFSTKGGKQVDFALCDPPSKAKVLIEVKKPGKASDGVKQALEYAFHTGVPFVVLTDGQTWSFYLPAEQGDYEQRRVFKLDLLEHPANRCAQVLVRYLGQQRVVSGESQEDALGEYKSQANRTRARDAIPQAWNRLVKQPNKSLIEVLSEEVVVKEGIRPEEKDVTQFLADLETRATPTPPTHRPGRPAPTERLTVPNKGGTKNPATSPNSRKHGTVVLFGEEHSYRNAKERLVVVLRELAKRDPAFLEHCYENSEFRGPKRRYISRRIEDLYPGRPDFQERNVEPLPNGWLLGTQLTNPTKEVLIQAAVKVASLELGRDIEI